MSAAAPGPSSSRDVALEAAHEHGGLAAVLAPREVGRGRGLVGDRDDRRVEHAPAASARPRQSSTAREPRDPDRDVALADAPRAAEGVGDDDRRGDAGQLAQPRAQRARGGVRVARQEHELAAAPALDASTPAFAQTKPWCVRQIEHARPRAHDLRALAEDDLDEARVLAVLGAERERALARLDVARARRPGPPPSRRPCARRRARRRRRAGSRGGARAAAPRGRRRARPRECRAAPRRRSLGGGGSPDRPARGRRLRLRCGAGGRAVSRR